MASVVGQAHCCSVVIVNNKNSVQLPTFSNSSRSSRRPKVNFGASRVHGSSGSVLGIVLGQGRGPVLVGAVGARLRVCGAVEDTD